MVKLLRLESNELFLNFDNSLNDSLIVKPQSQIALSSISWEKEHPFITIDGSNNEITIEFIDNGATSRLTAQLTTGIYSYATIHTLREDIENALNNMLTIDVPKCIGMNFKIEEEDNTNKLNIVSYQNDAFDFFRPAGAGDDDFNNVGVKRMASGAYEKISNASNAQNYGSALFGLGKSFFYKTSRGCGIFRVQINNLSTSAEKTGFLIGLTSTEPKNLGGDFDFDIGKYDFAIECGNTVQPYRFIKRDGVTGVKTLHNAAFNPTATADADTNDVLEISNNKGMLEGRIYTHAQSEPHLLFSEEYPPQLDVMYPVVAFKNKSDCSIKHLRYTPQKAQVVLSSVTSDDSGLYSTLTAQPPPQQRDVIDFNFIFEGRSLSDYLGFAQTTYSFTNVKDFDVIASETVEIFDRCESYIVELQSFGIDSYDMSRGKQKRRFLLALINNQKNKAERDVLYQINPPIYVDLNNKTDLLLKNLRMRVLNTNEQEVSIASVSNAVLLIKEKE